MKGSVAAIALAFAASGVSVAAHAQGAPAAPAAAKKVVRGVADLPVYSYQLPAAPSAMLEGPLDRVLALADAIAADDARTLAGYEIADRSAREAIIGRAMNAALLRRDVATVKRLAAELRGIQDRPDRKLTAGLMTEVAAESCAAADPAATARRVAAERLAPLPFSEVDTWARQQRAGLSTANPGLVVGSFKQSLDPVAAGNGNKVDMGLAAGIVAARAGLQCTLPVAPQLAEAVGAYVDKQAAAAPAAIDIWPARDVTLPANARARPVPVAIWDSGVDMALFKPAGDPGIAVDDRGRPMANALLRPVGEYKGREQELMDLVKGSMDLQSGIQSAEAQAFMQRVRSLKPDEAKAFGESVGFVSQYVHGTHVAGIAVAGNPFARVMAVTQNWPHRQEDFRLDRAVSEGRAAFYRDAVRRMQRAGVRVVNMSWRVGPQAFEGILQLQGGMPDAAERRRVAQELFAVEKAALEAAIRSAPEILFVAGAGNEANDANFADYIPAGIKAPNLLTVGAVDRSGREATFTSTGGAVAIHANGVEVESVFPGGQRRALSGTSMASPQVANAAAKLVAMKPSLTGAELRELLVSTADPQGRVRLLNTRAAFAKAGVTL